MTSQGDTRPPRAVKLEIDSQLAATAQAGGILIERSLRSLGGDGMDLFEPLRQDLEAHKIFGQSAMAPRRQIMPGPSAA